MTGLPWSGDLHVDAKAPQFAARGPGYEDDTPTVSLSQQRDRLGADESRSVLREPGMRQRGRGG
jgi:hypothetical protein